MLQHLHEKIHGWIAWVVVGLIGVTFLLWGVSSYQGGKGASTVKATVNGDEISARAFSEAYQRLKQQVPNLSAGAEKLLKTKAMDSLVYETVLQQATHKNGFYVTNQQVEQAILSIPEFQEGGVFSDQKFQQLLSSNFYTPSEFYTKVKNGILENQQRFSFVGTSFVMPNELTDFVKFADEKRTYDYVVIDPAALKLEPNITDKQLQQYYQSHPGDFMEPEKVSLEYVVLSLADIAKSIQPSEAQIEAFYKENQASFKVPAQYKIAHIFLEGTMENQGKPNAALQKKLAAVLTKLKEKGKFAEVATQYSDDLMAKQGELPWLTQGALEKPVDSALATLNIGQVSPPIHLANGIEIIKLLDKKEASLKPLAAVKSEIARLMKTEKAQAAFEQKAEALADLSYQNPDSLEGVTSALSLEVHKTPLIAKNDMFPAPLNNNKVKQAAYSEDVLKFGNNSQPIAVNDDMVVVIRKAKHQKAFQKPFAEVRAMIEQKLREQTRKEYAVTLGKELEEKVKQQLDKASLDAWLTAHQLRQQTAKDVARVHNGINDAINAFAFELIPSHTKSPTVSGKWLAQNQYAVVWLKQITAGEIKNIPTDKLTLIRQELATNNGNHSYELYLQCLLKQAKVDIKK